MMNGTKNMERGTGNGGLSNSTKECLCCRPRKMVVCNNCGFHGLGRVRQICSKHPGISYLSDWTLCPNCKGYCLNEH